MSTTSLRESLDHLENSAVPWPAWAVTFLAIVTIRNLLEGALGPAGALGFSYFASPSALMVLDHFLFFYVSVFLAIAILLSALSGQRIGRVMRVVIPAWTLVLVPPFLDHFLSGGEGVGLSYVLDPSAALWRFFDPRTAVAGVSAGQRVEILAACVLGAAYVQLKTRRAWRSFTAFAAIYAVVAAHALLPGAFARLGALALRLGDIPAARAYEAAFKTGGMILEESRKLAVLFLITSAGLAWWAFRMHAPAKARALIRNARPLRTLHYVGMTLFGAVFAWVVFASVGVRFAGSGDVLGVAALLLSTYMAVQASVSLNDFFDLEADRISEISRPLVTGALSRRDAVTAAVVWAGGALLLALNVKYATFLVMLLALAVSYLYSARPVRLKRFPVIATLTLGVATYLAVLIGFSSYAGERVFAVFPQTLAWMLVLSFGLAFTAKDLKDIGGDRADGTLTLPILTGPRRARWIIAAFVFAGYGVAALLLPSSPFRLAAAGVGALSAALVVTVRGRRIADLLLAIYLAFALVTAGAILRDPGGLLEPTHPVLGAKALEIEGDALATRDLWQQAADRYAAASRTLTGDPSLPRRAGIALVHAGLPGDAIEMLGQSLELEPSSPVSREFLCEALTGAGHGRHARQLLFDSVQLGVRPRVFLARLGELYLESPDKSFSITKLSEALHVGQPDIPTRIQLADALAAQGDVIEARTQYELVLARHPRTAEAHAAYGRFLLESGDARAALGAFRRAALLAPRSAVHWNDIGAAYRLLGRHEDAAASLDRALQLDPLLAEAHYNRGLIHEATGQARQARREYLLALEADPQYRPAWDALRALGNPGNAAKARPEQEKPSL